MDYPVENYGNVVYGPVSDAQMSENLQTLHDARGAALEQGGGAVQVSGKLYINATADFSGLGQTTIGLAGNSMLGSGLYYGGSDPIEHLVSLFGTSYFAMRDLTINGGDVVEYGLYCARDVPEHPAGKHTFHNVRAVECAKASHLNYASEDNAYFKCQFQRSPIGAIFTAYPVADDVADVGAVPADFSEAPQSSLAHHLYDCAIGSEAFTSRCGLMVLGSVTQMFGGVIQTARGAEAGVVLEGTRGRRATFRDIYLDGNLPLIGYKIGYFTKGRQGGNWRNRVYISGDITIDGVDGSAFISAYGLNHSSVEGVFLNGPPDVSVGFDLLDSNCRGNLFVNCVHGDNRDVQINRLNAAQSNILLSNGAFNYLTQDQKLRIRYEPSLPGRIFVESGLYVYYPAGIDALALRRDIDSQARLLFKWNGGVLWGDGSSPPSTSVHSVP